MRAHRVQRKPKFIVQDWQEKMKDHDNLVFEIPEQHLSVYEVIGGSANHLGALLDLQHHG